MTSKKPIRKAGKALTKHKANPAKGTSTQGSVQRDETESYAVAPESRKVIERALATHRDTLKRLADR